MLTRRYMQWLAKQKRRGLGAADRHKPSESMLPRPHDAPALDNEGFKDLVARFEDDQEALQVMMTAEQARQDGKPRKVRQDYLKRRLTKIETSERGRDADQQGTPKREDPSAQAAETVPSEDTAAAAEEE